MGAYADKIIFWSQTSIKKLNICLEREMSGRKGGLSFKGGRKKFVGFVPSSFAIPQPIYLKKIVFFKRGVSLHK